METNQTAKYKVAWLDTPHPEVEKINRALLPPEFSLVLPGAPDDNAELMQLVSDADFVMLTGIHADANLIRNMKKCKLIQKWGIGVDGIDLKAAQENGIPVAITAGANSIPVAELVIAHILTLYRRILIADANTRAGRWINKELRTQCSKIHGKKAGIIGMGNIGQHLSRILRAFGAEVVYYDVRRLTDEKEAELGVRYESLDSICMTCDIISLHVPYTPETRHIIGEKEISLMKPNAIIINAARGGLIDESALLPALQNNLIGGAGLDVHEIGRPTEDYPFSKLDNVVLTPHNGGGTLDNVENVTLHAYSNMLKILKGEAIDPRDFAYPKNG